MHVTPLLNDLKWINFNSMMQQNDASIIYKNLNSSADSNVKKIDFGFRNKVSRRTTRNGSDLHIDNYRRTAKEQKVVSVLLLLLLLKEVGNARLGESD